jgi:hypothetical protein
MLCETTYQIGAIGEACIASAITLGDNGIVEHQDGTSQLFTGGQSGLPGLPGTTSAAGWRRLKGNNVPGTESGEAEAPKAGAYSRAQPFPRPSPGRELCHHRHVGTRSIGPRRAPRTALPGTGRRQSPVPAGGPPSRSRCTDGPVSSGDVGQTRTYVCSESVHGMSRKVERADRRLLPLSITATLVMLRAGTGDYRG